MIVSKYTLLNIIKIKAPKYSTKELLVAKYKVKHSNKIIIQEGAYQGEYFMHGSKIAQYPIGTNGKINVFKIPLDDLEPLEYKEDITKLISEIFN
jgi:hypothetical protein